MKKGFEEVFYGFLMVLIMVLGGYKVVLGGF